MASFGAKYPRFSPIKTEPESALPQYEGPVSLGRLVKAELTITMASGKLYADDALAESVDEFSSGSVAMETDDITDESAGKVYGATVTEKKVSYKAGDSAPMGGLAYYKVLMRNGKKLFKGFFYPRVKAVLGNDTAQTKGDSITFVPLAPARPPSPSFGAIRMNGESPKSSTARRLRPRGWMNSSRHRQNKGTARMKNGRR